MSITAKLRHWFTPHHTNNFRAHLLHNSGILAIIGIILSANVFIRLLDSTSLHILGFTSSVTIDEVVRATNEQRISAGLKPLSYNERLADAARRKAANMFEENYWAHNSPSGKSPWVWFTDAGYNYVFAGENLAKDFGSTDRLMSAWMASTTHHDNIVNPKYSEIGIAVVPGTLQGQETVLVVQLFGAAQGGFVSKEASAKAAPTPAPIQVAEVKGQEVVEPVAPPSSPVPAEIPKWNQFNLARTLNLGTTALFILALILDLLLAESHQISRRVGNNWAHILFINFILLATTIVNAGKIL
ncbi:MAG: CAP domain-containing protein [bacterium]